jgi:hypothetical protein
MPNLIEIEIDGPRNESLYFQPLMRKVRGRVDFLRSPDKQGRGLFDKWPTPIPGERLGIDLQTGTGYVLEPLHDKAHADTRRRIEANKLRLQDERQEFPNAHVPTWLNRMKAAVESGIAKLVTGKLPERIDGEPDLTVFSRSAASRTDALLAEMAAQNARLAAAFERLASGIERLAKK